MWRLLVLLVFPAVSCFKTKKTQSNEEQIQPLPKIEENKSKDTKEEKKMVSKEPLKLKNCLDLEQASTDNPGRKPRAHPPTDSHRDQKGDCSGVIENPIVSLVTESAYEVVGGKKTDKTQSYSMSKRKKEKKRPEATQDSVRETRKSSSKETLESSKNSAEYISEEPPTKKAPAVSTPKLSPNSVDKTQEH